MRPDGRVDPAGRRHPRSQDRPQGGQLHRGHPGLPGSDRRHRRALPRVPARRRRAGAGHRRGDRRACRRG